MPNLIGKLAAALLTLSLCAVAAAASPPRVVTVLYFDNNSTNRDLDVLQKGLADMLVTDLAGVEGIQVVEREKLEQLLAELKLQRTKFFDAATVQKLGRGMGAEYAVTGAFTSIDPRLRIDIRLVEIATGKVVMADQVSGAKDRFFELEEELVRKFTAGLSGRPGDAPVTSGAARIEDVVEYGKGLDKADRGDYAGASAQLAQVMGHAPGFHLAKSRYTEYMKRLYAAGQKRKVLLDENSEQLMRNAAAAIANRDVTHMTEDEAARYFGYRAVRSQYISWRIGKLKSDWALPEAKLAEALPLMRAWFDNHEIFVRDGYQWVQRGADRRRYCRIDAVDVDRAVELGIADRGDIPACYGYRHTEALDLVEWAATGSGKRWIIYVTPSLVRLDPSYGERALQILELVAQDMAKGPKAGAGDTIEITERRAELLLAMGRREEAIAAWQSLLDKFPKNGRFPDWEKHVKLLLGLTPELQAIEALIASCGPDTRLTPFEQHVDALYESGGAELVLEKLAALEKCVLAAPGPQYRLPSLYWAAGMIADRNVDCKLGRDVKQRALGHGADVKLTNCLP